MQDYQELFASEQKRVQLAKFLSQELVVSKATNTHCIPEMQMLFILSTQKYKFDGAVLEIWSQLGGHYRK